MATNGINGIITTAKTLVCFNYWDSYPNELGDQMVWFIKKEMKPHFRKRIRDIEPVTMDQYEKLISVYGERYANNKVVRRGRSLRGIFEKAQGVVWLIEVQEGRLKHVYSEIEYLDDYQCKYGYIINLPDETLDFYAGGFQQPAEYCDYSSFPAQQGINGYYNIQLIQKFPFGMIKRAMHTEEIVNLMTDFEGMARAGVHYRMMWRSIREKVKSF